MLQKNPFALSTGEAMNGKLDEYMDWRKARWNECLETLPEDEREATLRRKRALSRRMASEAGYLDPKEEVMGYVESLEDMNPHSKISGWPKEGEQTEWAEWNKKYWNSRIASRYDSTGIYTQMEGQIFERWEKGLGDLL
jgi:hypothetical protein